MPITRAYAQAAEPGNFFVAGKNKIINGDFRINQRAFTSVSSGYGFDRWIFANSGATGTYTPQTFTLGTAPVAGYEGTTFARVAVTTGNDFARLFQPIESVRTFAGQTITISFWAKGTNPTTAGNLSVAAVQYFGSGGSPSATIRTVAGTFVLTASWTRYSLTVAVPSISGKTIGTDGNDFLEIAFGQEASVSTDAWTLDIWGVQAEVGSVATPFSTATGTLAGELAACQRYYFRLGNDNTAVNRSICTGAAYASNDASGVVQFPTTMRTTPTLDATSGTNYYGFMANSATDGFNSFTLGYADRTSAIIYNASQISQTAGHAGQFVTQSASASVAFSSEL